MMKTTITLLVAIFINFSLSSQNLVPNPSFEETDCNSDFGFPTYYGASGWFNSNSATPDYFGDETDVDCWLYSTNTPALIAAGEWIVPRTGEKIAGLWAGDGTSCTRDILEIRLLDSLVSGQKYCVTFYAQLSNVSSLATNRLGIYFSNDSLVNHASPCWLNGLEHVGNNSGTFLTDTLNWVEISGEYTATGGEKFLLIGTLIDNTNAEFIEVQGTKSWTWAYYYVDDVTVINCEPISDLGTLDRIQVGLFPNPVDKLLQIDSNSLISFDIYNSLGQVVYSGKHNNYLSLVDVSNWTIGSYYFIGLSGQSVVKKRFVVYH